MNQGPTELHGARLIAGMTLEFDIDHRPRAAILNKPLDSTTRIYL